VSLINPFSEMSREEIITGQIFFREKALAKKLDLTNRKIFLITGIIAIPPFFPFKSEHMYDCGGMNTSSETLLSINHLGKDIRDLSLGSTPDQLITKPIWRI
jgi:hypothetical protein